MPTVLNGEKIAPSIVNTGSSTISRVHETRVEIDAECIEMDLDYTRGDERITDVVIVSAKDATESLFQISKIISALREIPHVNAVRLRSLKFNYEPESYSPVVIDKLASLNKLTMVNPLRLEIETQFLVADEFQPVHTRLTRLLNNKGITVYNNTPLLGRINDTPGAIHHLAYACRKAGIEFHHLYVAGLPLQDHWNTKTRWRFTTSSISPQGSDGKAAAGRCPAILSARSWVRWISDCHPPLSEKGRICRLSCFPTSSPTSRPYHRISPGPMISRKMLTANQSYRLPAF